MRGWTTSLLLALVMSAIGNPLFAQSLPVTSYTTDDGLSYSQVWALHQDRRGYVWVGTTDGLNRWDGSRFTTFSTQDGLSDSTVRVIVESDDGTLWLGTDNGVVSFDGRRIRQYDVPSLEGLIWTGTKDRYGRIWFGTLVHGASYLEDGEFHAVGVNEGLASRYVYSLFSDSKGFLWFGHRGDGVTRCRAVIEGGIEECRTFGLDDGLPHLDVRSFAEDRRGNIFIATRGGGIARWDGNELRTFDTTHGIGENDIYSLLVLDDDQIAVGTLSRGLDLCRLPDITGCRSYRVANGLPDDATLALLQDREDAIWVGYQSGLARISTGDMLSFTVRDGLPHSTAYAVLGDPNGNVWIGTLGGLAEVRIDEQTGTASRLETFTSDNGLPGSQIWDLMLDREQRIWVATEAGLCQFDTSSRSCVRTIDTDDGLASNDLITLRESSRGEILTSSTEGLSIIRIEGNKVSIRNVSVDEGLAGSIVYGIGEDRYGRIWVGSDQGLSSIDGERVENHTTDDGLPHNEIHVIHRDEDGLMWIGTNGGGLASFDPPEPGSATPPQFVTYGPEVGVRPDIAAIAPADEGRFWLATTRGAILFDPALAKRGQRAVVAVVDRASGLVGNEINAFDYDASGHLWIAIAGGATRYDSDAVTRGVNPPLVAIESVLTPDSLWMAPFSKPVVERNNRSWLDGSKIDLAPRSATIRIDYRALSFRQPKRVVYQVRLIGFRNEWSDATNATFKEYTNLFPGPYTFEVRSSVRSGEWSEPERIEISLLPAWWQRRSFIAASLAGFLLLLGVGYRARTYAINRRNLELERAVDERTDDLRRYARALEEHSHALDRANFRIREADRVKSEFLANMSHELRTPLNSIIGFSDVLVPSLESRIEERQHRFLKNIQTSGRYLLLLINNLLDLSKIEAGRADVFAETARVDEIVETTCEIVRGYAEDQNIKVHASVPDSMPEVIIDVPKFRQVLLNLLSNAVKFSMRGDVVEVQVRQVAASDAALGVDAFELIVRDHGPGISAADREAIFEEFRQVGGGVSHPGGTGLGLALVRRFVDLLGGRIALESTPGSGTAFTVELPMEYRTDPEGEPILAGDSGQPRVIILSDSEEVFTALASTMEREGFAPVRTPTIEDALKVSRRVDPVAAIISIDLGEPDDWGMIRAIGNDPSLSNMTIGICLTSGNEVVMAIGVDSLLLQPFTIENAVTHISSFAGPEDPPPIFIEDDRGRLSELGEALCGNAYQSRHARGSAEAVALVSKESPGVIVVDLAARSLAGIDAVRRIQLEKQTRHTPIVVIAPEMLDLDTSASFSAVSIDDIEAPLDELALTMHELLRRRGARGVRLAAASLT